MRAVGEKWDPPDNVGEEQHLCQQAGKPGEESFKLRTMGEGDGNLRLSEQNTEKEWKIKDVGVMGSGDTSGRIKW